MLRAFLLLPVFSFSQTFPSHEFKIAQNGLQYYIEQKGTGKKVRKGDTLLIDFIWYSKSKNHEIKYSTYMKGETPQNYVVDSGYYVKGFEKSIKKLRRTGCGFFIIPPKLAYGSNRLEGEDTLFYYIKIVR